MVKDWTPEEDAMLITLYRNGIPMQEIAVRLGRTEGSVQGRVNRNRKRWKLISRHRYCCFEERVMLADYLKTHSVKEAAVMFNRSVDAIAKLCYRYGIIACKAQRREMIYHRIHTLRKEKKTWERIQNIINNEFNTHYTLSGVHTLYYTQALKTRRTGEI